MYLNQRIREGGVVAIVILFFLAAPTVSAASPARLFLMPTTSEVGRGELVRSEVWVSAERMINAAEVVVSVNPREVEVVSAEKSSDAFDVWVREPAVNAASGQVVFAGGSTSGISGAKKIGAVYWRALVEGEVTLTIASSSSVALADGLGTLTEVSAQSATYTVMPVPSGLVLRSPNVANDGDWTNLTSVSLAWEKRPGAVYSYDIVRSLETPLDDVPDEPVGAIQLKGLEDGVYYFRLKEKIGAGSWSTPLTRLVKIDRTPPTPFEVKVSQNNNLLGGKRFLSFVALDALSGVIGYDIQEGEAAPVRVTAPPYILLDQEQRAAITIRATDAAGNERVVVVPSRPASVFTMNWPGWYSWGMVGVGILLLLIGFVVARRRGQK